MWVVMRCDYSAVLVMYPFLWGEKSDAQRVAAVYCGHAVKWKVAKKILTINKMIGR